MKIRFICVFLMWTTFMQAADIESTIRALVEEDIAAIKGHCASMKDSKVFNYVMREINKKKVAIPGFDDDQHHFYEVQQLITDTTNYNEVYKTLCNNGAVQSDMFNSLIIDNYVITAYTPLREQALNVIVYQLQTIVNYQQ